MFWIIHDWKTLVVLLVCFLDPVYWISISMHQICFLEILRSTHLPLQVRRANNQIAYNIDISVFDWDNLTMKTRIRRLAYIKMAYLIKKRLNYRQIYFQLLWLSVCICFLTYCFDFNCRSKPRVHVMMGSIFFQFATEKEYYRIIYQHFNNCW